MMVSGRHLKHLQLATALLILGGCSVDSGSPKSNMDSTTTAVVDHLSKAALWADRSSENETCGQQRHLRCKENFHCLNPSLSAAPLLSQIPEFFEKAIRAGEVAVVAVDRVGAPATLIRSKTTGRTRIEVDRHRLASAHLDPVVYASFLGHEAFHWWENECFGWDTVGEQPLNQVEERAFEIQMQLVHRARAAGESVLTPACQGFVNGVTASAGAYVYENYGDQELRGRALDILEGGSSLATKVSYLGAVASRLVEWLQLGTDQSIPSSVPDSVRTHSNARAVFSNGVRATYETVFGGLVYPRVRALLGLSAQASVQDIVTTLSGVVNKGSHLKDYWSFVESIRTLENHFARPSPDVADQVEVVLPQFVCLI